MNQQHFKCTACGKCCYGWLPLTLGDALAHVCRFPLALIWTPVRATSRSHALAKQLGTSVQLPNRQKIAVVVTPAAYLPPSFPCPALSSDALCSLHANKPLRCRTMPFDPACEESEQARLLIPRKDWRCDTSPAAPLVYTDRTIVDRADFDRERAEIMAAAPLMRAYIQTTLKHNASVMNSLVQTATNPAGGRLVVNFWPLLRQSPDHDLIAFARRQRPVLTHFAETTAARVDLAEYHAYYRAQATDLEWYAAQPDKAS